MAHGDSHEGVARGPYSGPAAFPTTRAPAAPPQGNPDLPPPRFNLRAFQFPCHRACRRGKGRKAGERALRYSSPMAGLPRARRRGLHSVGPDGPECRYIHGCFPGAVREPLWRRDRRLVVPPLPFPTRRNWERKIGLDVPIFRKSVGIPIDLGRPRARL